MALLEHDGPAALPIDESFRALHQVIPCPTAFSFKTSGPNLAAYANVLPAVFVPNWSDGTYATCARLSREHADKMRVLGLCHTCHPYYFRTLRFYEPLIHRFIAVSEECARALKTMLPARAMDVLTRPYAVSRPPTLDRAYPPPGKPLRLLYAGRIIEEQKRVSDLLRLAEALHRRGVDFRLRVLGDGPAKGKLARGVWRLPRDLAGRISLEGEVAPARMPVELSSADICLLVSEYEGTSLFMLEGMASGCVPVVTQVSGTAGVIDPGVNGFAVPVGNVEEMARVIQGLDEDRPLLRHIGTRAHQTLAQYDYGSYLSWFDGVIEGLWSEGPRAWPKRRNFLPARTFVRGVVRAVVHKGRALVKRIPGVEWGRAWLGSHLRGTAAGSPRCDTSGGRPPRKVR